MNLENAQHKLKLTTNRKRKDDLRKHTKLNEAYQGVQFGE